MAKLKPYMIEGFDYDGYVNEDLYEECQKTIGRKRSAFNENDILASANWDLQLLSNRHKRNPSEQLAAKVRAMYNVVIENV